LVESRALALTKGKRDYERARDRLRDRCEFIDVAPGVDVPSFRPDRDTLAAIDAIMAHRPFHHVVATSESDMAFAGFLRSRYGLDGLGFDASLVVTNKWRMKQAVRPVYATADGWLSGDFLELPPAARPATVIVKPLSSSAAVGVERMAADEADRWPRDSDELFLVEEALEVADEYHCDGLVRDGRLQWLVVSAYDRPVLASFRTTYASLHLAPSDPRAVRATDAVRRVVPALPARDFVFHMELLEVGGDLVFGEVGLRPAGSGIPQSISHSLGADIWLEFVGLQVGVPQTLSPAPRRRDDVCGVLAAVPPEHGGGTLSAEDALELPGVTAVADGNLPPGEWPKNSCSYTYLAFFEGLAAAADVTRLIRAVDQAQPASRV
jgi:hypothetical protein